MAGQSRKVPPAPQIPESIVIGAYTYEVGVRETADEGSFTHKAQQITVSPNRGQDATADTLLHECMHGLFVQTGLRDVVGEKTEERLVQALTPLLLQTIRANPGLIAFLVTR